MERRATGNDPEVDAILDRLRVAIEEVVRKDPQMGALHLLLCLTQWITCIPYVKSTEQVEQAMCLSKLGLNMGPNVTKAMMEFLDYAVSDKVEKRGVDGGVDHTSRH